MDTLVGEIGRRESRLWVSTSFSLSVDNEQGDKVSGTQTCLARPNSEARTGSCSANHNQKSQPYPVFLSVTILPHRHTHKQTHTHKTIIDPPLGGSMRVA